MITGTGGTLKVNGKTIAVGAWRLTRTPEQAFRDDIRRDPLDATRRLVFADWLDEQGKPVAAALERVLAEPDSDAHRLHYADACERAGQGERAEFIRVQCELAGLVEYAESMNWLIGAASVSIDRLRSRERALSDRQPGDSPSPPIRSWAGPLLCMWGHDLHTPGVEGGNRAVWERGFVESLTCTAVDLLAHADDILAAHPVRRVTLTTWPTPTLVWEHGGPPGGPRERTVAWLHERWPGVAFTLPPT